MIVLVYLMIRELLISAYATYHFLGGFESF